MRRSNNETARCPETACIVASRRPNLQPAAVAVKHRSQKGRPSRDLMQAVSYADKALVNYTKWTSDDLAKRRSLQGCGCEPERLLCRRYTRQIPEGGSFCAN